MIVRERADGTLILIGQTDHTKLSVQCAAHWGNQYFAKPKPYEAVVRAAKRVQPFRREIGRGAFADPAAFREAYFKAIPVAVDFMLCSP